MSYNVTGVWVLGGALEISQEGREWLERKTLNGDTPADSCLPENAPRWGTPREDGWVPITNMWWSGDGSGESVACGAWVKFLGFTRGKADIVLVWEGGESMTGYRVENGKVTEHDVVLTLGRGMSNDLRETLEAECKGIKVDTFGGSCPVQVEGTIDGLPFYFRARGASWSMSIAQDKDGDPVETFGGGPGWFYEEPFGVWPDAGYMPDDDVRKAIVGSVKRWRESRAPKATLC